LIIKNKPSRNKLEAAFKRKTDKNLQMQLQDFLEIDETLTAMNTTKPASIPKWAPYGLFSGAHIVSPDLPNVH